MKWQEILTTPRQRLILERLVRISEPPVTLVPMAVEVEKMIDEAVASALAGKQKRRKPK